MAKYTEAKSNFVKEKIKNAKFKDRGYIDNLLFMESAIAENESLGFAGSMKMHGLKSRYEKEYMELLKELAPEKIDRFLKEKRNSEKEEKEAEEFFEKEEEQDKKDWLKAGGKI